MTHTNIATNIAEQPLTMHSLSRIMIPYTNHSPCRAYSYQQERNHDNHPDHTSMIKNKIVASADAPPAKVASFLLCVVP